MLTHKLLTTLILVICLKSLAFGNTHNLEWVVSHYPCEVNELLNSLDYNKKKLKVVEKWHKKGNPEAACKALVDYYKTGNTAHWYRKANYQFQDNSMICAHIDNLEQRATEILNNKFEFQKVKAQHPSMSFNRNPEAQKSNFQRLLWYDLGPNFDIEWAYMLNRHGFLYTLLAAYHNKANSEFVRYIDHTIADWIIANPLPGNYFPSPQWRVLEAGLRMQVWPVLFYYLQGETEFSDATRLLMLISLKQHAEYLAKYHWKKHNHAVMEMAGLAEIAICWPEFKESADWFNYARTQMEAELAFEVLPDGVQNELAASYHKVTLFFFQFFVETAKRGQKEVSDDFAKTIESMYDYMVYSLNPALKNPLNNDSDVDNNETFLMRAAKFYDRPDWIYVLTHGRQGEKPNKNSVFYPYAGQAILRTGFGENALFSFFDVGPAGNAHQHDDKLHISLYAYGREILSDAGRYWYKPGNWRQYFRNSLAHNVVLIDGYGQKREEKTLKTPLINSFFDIDTIQITKGSYSTGFHNINDPLIHHRTLILYKGKFWIVIDKIDGLKQEREVSTLWHFHPDCNVKKNAKGEVFTNDKGTGNLLIYPVNSAQKLDLLKGQNLELPEKNENPWASLPQKDLGIQGWFSPAYNEKTPCFTATYKKKASSSQQTVWVLHPFTDQQPDERIVDYQFHDNKLILTLEQANKKQESIKIPLR